ncbi:MAG: TIGR00159 family protein [Candidatus Cloacimonetes bacterium 4572_55]|nr:MAG: TIGR00159 family protein [Candidatus Cloacimonetes bacterium 4572_55]
MNVPTASDFFFFELRAIDAVDILIVSFLFYKLYILIRGSKAFQMAFGLLVIILASFAADLLKMNALSWIISAVKAAWVVTFVILFQPELRGALASMGRGRLASFFSRTEVKQEKVSEIMSAVKEMSAHRIGALIVFLRESELDDFITSGKRINAEVTSELLVTIFIPKTPLHDGALLIKKDKILAAGVILPLSKNTNLPKELGTRHRAGIGLTEERDSVVIIVSEETGKVSLVVDGEINRKMTLDELEKRVKELLS